MRTMKIAVLYGGISSEREVSIKSGRAVIEALTEVGHQVVGVDVTSDDPEQIRGVRADVFFPALHGRFGEDGGVQAILEGMGAPYVGSDAQASQVAFDKMASKCFFASHGVPTPAYRLVAATMRWQEIDQAVCELGLPVIVKPLRQGSSVGVARADTMDQAADALARAFTFGRQALVESCVIGRELTVGVLGELDLPPVELRTSRGIFDWYSKYEDQATEYIVDADLPEDTAFAVSQAAVAAHRCLGCRHLSRVDMMLDQEGQPNVLEVNTIPGFTARSLFPMAARAIGIEFPRLCERLCRNALSSASVHVLPV